MDFFEAFINIWFGFYYDILISDKMPKLEL